MYIIRSTYLRVYLVMLHFNQHFHRYTPPGLFETLIVRALRPAHDMTSLQHWTDGLYARCAAQVRNKIYFWLKHSLG